VSATRGDASPAGEARRRTSLRERVRRFVPMTMPIGVARAAPSGEVLRR
jgi:hypothetical protein